VFSHLVGMPFDELPGWLRRWAKLDPLLVSVEDINLDGILQLGELRLGQDIIVLAAPEIGGLPFVVTYLVAAGGLAAALSTADGLLLTIANALSHDVYYRVINPGASAIRRVMLSKVLVLMVALLAAWIASLRITDILQYVSGSGAGPPGWEPSPPCCPAWGCAPGTWRSTCRGCAICLAWRRPRRTCAGGASSRCPPGSSACRWAWPCCCW
jgi:hypothetical protein